MRDDQLQFDWILLPFDYMVSHVSLNDSMFLTER